VGVHWSATVRSWSRHECLRPIGRAPKTQIQKSGNFEKVIEASYAFGLTPVSPPLHRMERGNGGEVSFLLHLVAFALIG
jgi:hypothetical protein